MYDFGIQQKGSGAALIRILNHIKRTSKIYLGVKSVLQQYT